MPTPIIPSYSPKSGDSLEVRMKSLENAFIDLTQQYLFLLKHLDSSNVKNVVTESTSIRSRHGETTIQGPLLIMKDKQGTPVVRLKMGYDKDSTDFVHQLMNAAGDVTISLDSNGDLVVERGTFKGSITIGTVNNVIKANGTDGLWVGNADFVSAPFKVNPAGQMTASAITITGGTITIGTGDNVFKVDANGIYLGNALFANAPFKVGMDGQAETSNLIITGGSISVATDAYIGNNVYLGVFDDHFNAKRVYFNDLANITGDSDNIEFNCMSVGFFSVPTVAFNGNIAFNTSTAYGSLDFDAATVTGLESSGYKSGDTTGNDSHSHTVVVDGATYTTSSNTHSHSQT
jgi:hypothetical protein